MKVVLTISQNTLSDKMKKAMRKFLLLILIIIPVSGIRAQVFNGKNGSVKLLGKAPKETITASSQTLRAKIDIASREFNFRQNLNQFAFSQGDLQKKDAEEMYWETDKYPNADFKGKIINDVDLSKDGTYNVTAVGKFSMHGVAKDVKVPATIKVSNGILSLNSKLKIFLSDYNIKIPRLVVLKVAEEFEADISLTLTN